MRRIAFGCRGQATVEFTLLALTLSMALLLPWPGGLSPAEWLLGAIIASAQVLAVWLAVI